MMRNILKYISINLPKKSYLSIGLVLVLLVCTLPITGWAKKAYIPEHPDPFLESWRWRSFNTLDGLGLRCMTETKDGTMWFGVEKGVYSYDGTTWEMYNRKDGIIDTPVNTLLSASDGSIYASSNRGISQYKNGTWFHTFPKTRNTKWQIFDLIETDTGTIWAATNRGLLRIKSKSEFDIFTL